MSDDLVKRLRSCANGAWLFKTKQGDFGICDDAADRIEALTAERDALIRDRDRWVAEAQASTSPIVAGLTADNARLRQRIQNQTDQINGLERSRRRLESLMAGADRRVEAVEAEGARLRALLSDLLQVQDGVPMMGAEATRRSEAARAALTGKETK